MCVEGKKKEDRLEGRVCMCKHICNYVNVCVHALKTKPIEAVRGG